MSRSLNVLEHSGPHELSGISSLSFVLHDYSITSSLIGSFEKCLMTSIIFELSLLILPLPLLHFFLRINTALRTLFKNLHSVFFLEHEKPRFIAI
jgi:hypothetical protein